MTITWSYSGQKTFSQCPRQYHEVKIKKSVKSSENPATRYGKQAHEAIENYLIDGTPIDPRFKRFQPWVDKIAGIKGDRYVEYKMGITFEGKSCDFDAPDVWWHGIPDVLVVNNESGVARVVDWKTSKSSAYADTDQLELLALATFAQFPEVHTVKGALIFLVCRSVVKKEFVRKDFNLILSKWMGRINMIEEAMSNGVWNPKQSALCRFCPVESCEYHNAT